MASTIYDVTTSEVTLGRLDSQFIGGVSADQFRASIQGIDVNDPASCQKAVTRCNNRCNGNDVDVKVKVAALSAGGGDPQPGSTAESFSVSFRMAL